MTKIAVFGAGTWGIALARLLAANGRDVTVWSAIPAELKSLSTTHRHPNLPGMELPAAMHYTADIAEACTGRDILLFAVPSPFVRATAKKAAPHIPEGQLIVDVAKGVEDKTLMTMSEIIEDELAKAGRKARVVALSGPTHAEEVARDMPTAIVAASADEDAAKTVQKVFTTPTFRVYTNDDRRGTELGGAVKNVIALARLLAANGRDVTVWSAIPAELKSLSTTHRHPNLPGMELPAAMHYTADIAEACTGRDILLFAVPSPFVRATAKKAAPHIPEGQLIVDVAKGVEDKTLMTMSEIIEDELAKAGRKARVVALSGPTHAEEVARDMPTAIVAASADEDAAKTVQKVFTTPTFRVYTNDDRRGTELGGAVKNVIALAVGIALGLGYGDNAKAALITRGNAELSRLGIAMGCKAETFAGLSGMGDLIVTCTSMHSRNLHAGMLIGRGKSVEEAKTEVGQVVEGINALPAACRLAKQYKVEMPIVQAVEAILDGKLEARSALMALMGRSLKRE